MGCRLYSRTPGGAAADTPTKQGREATVAVPGLGAGGALGVNLTDGVQGQRLPGPRSPTMAESFQKAAVPQDAALARPLGLALFSSVFWFRNGPEVRPWADAASWERADPLAVAEATCLRQPEEDPSSCHRGRASPVSPGQARLRAPGLRQSERVAVVTMTSYSGSLSLRPLATRDELAAKQDRQRGHPVGQGRCFRWATCGPRAVV